MKGDAIGAIVGWKRPVAVAILMSNDRRSAKIYPLSVDDFFFDPAIALGLITLDVEADGEFPLLASSHGYFRPKDPPGTTKDGKEGENFPLRGHGND